MKYYVIWYGGTNYFDNLDSAFEYAKRLLEEDECSRVVVSCGWHEPNN